MHLRANMKTVIHIQKPVSEKKQDLMFFNLHSQHEAHTAHNIKKSLMKKKFKF